MLAKDLVVVLAEAGRGARKLARRAAHPVRRPSYGDGPVPCDRANARNRRLRDCRRDGCRCSSAPGTPQRLRPVDVTVRSRRRRDRASGRRRIVERLAILDPRRHVAKRESRAVAHRGEHSTPLVFVLDRQRQPSLMAVDVGASIGTMRRVSLERVARLARPRGRLRSSRSARARGCAARPRIATCRCTGPCRCADDSRARPVSARGEKSRCDEIAIRAVRRSGRLPFAVAGDVVEARQRRHQLAESGVHRVGSGLPLHAGREHDQVELIARRCS